MKISTQDAELFFDLLWSLQFYAKQRLGLLPDVTTLAAYRDVGGAQRMEIRNALWDNPHLIKDYVKANPDNLEEAHLAIVASWQQFVRGKFFIERLLKKHAIFINDDKVYGVLALYDAFDEMFPRQMLPVYVEGVLLPFKGVIVYDGLLSRYSIMFGGGMKRNFKDTYMKAKRAGRIIVSFDAAAQAAAQAKMKKPLKDWQPAIAALTAEAKSLRAQAGSPLTWGAAFSLVKASLALAKTAVAAPNDSDALWKQFERVVRAIDKMEDAIYRS